MYVFMSVCCINNCMVCLLREFDVKHTANVISKCQNRILITKEAFQYWPTFDESRSKNKIYSTVFFAEEFISSTRVLGRGLGISRRRKAAEMCLVSWLPSN